MASGEPRISVSVLRGAVRDAIDRTSSHVVAKAVGLSAPGIREFANGAEPRSATIRKLTAWYIRQREHGSDAPVDAETAEAAIAFLLEHIPAQHRDETRAALLELIRSKGRQVGGASPAWIEDLGTRG
jgi:hypothetical protein